MAQFYVVLRPFEGEQAFTAGEVVDVTAWRLARQLVERRYIRPATEAEIAAATEVESATGAETESAATEVESAAATAPPEEQPRSPGRRSRNVAAVAEGPRDAV
jgi:hypothetical protein